MLTPYARSTGRPAGHPRHRLFSGIITGLAMLILAAGLPASAQQNPVSPAKTQNQAQTPPDSPLGKVTIDLFKAVELNDMASVKTSIEAGADLFAANELGMTAADLAVDKGHFIIAHYLLSRRMLGQTPPIALLPGKTPKKNGEGRAPRRSPVSGTVFETQTETTFLRAAGQA
ncbi:MAG: ankyrin repeat domain-containing protein [Alphaproteobacteria bacterium]|nr:ankyrin repeat domain-containing protein [Alphaproteobacteria bacterium]